MAKILLLIANKNMYKRKMIIIAYLLVASVVIESSSQTEDSSHVGLHLALPRAGIRDQFDVSCDSLRVKLHRENLHFLKRRFHFLLGVKSVTCKNGND